ncbi:uncharacterized protein LOC129722910 [Wyeomyia smithii]|uniref:uncharacterized protein LOC129722910 n=1 Tax=Wyeomyia smithii TaxID=174621 RepID=UPI002467B84E|nr:uncharacterized protein LOC129722910 [Wyeomyia smithii]
MIVLIALCLVSGAFGSLLCPIKFDPDQTVHLAHPTDCGKFLTCVGSNPVEQFCPLGLHWNEETNFCDYPRATNCSRGDAVEQAWFNVSAISTSQHCLPQSEKCPLISKPQEEVVFLKHRNCRKFYACVAAQPIELSCPHKLYWNSKSCICDYDSDNECDDHGDRINDSDDQKHSEEEEGDQEAEQEVEQPSDGDDEDKQPEEVEQPSEGLDEDKEPEAEQGESEASVVESAVRVRRAADSSGSSSSGSGSNSGSGSSSGSGSGSNSGTGSGSSSGSGSEPVQSGADAQTISSIAVLLVTAILSVS